MSLTYTIQTTKERSTGASTLMKKNILAIRRGISTIILFHSTQHTCIAHNIKKYHHTIISQYLFTKLYNVEYKTDPQI